jgi:RimJ/RimL family protein N-acetyltransferase
MTTTSRPHVDVTRVTLADGREVSVRELLPSDEAALVAAIKGADPVDLRRRFMGAPPPVSLLLERLRTADGVHNFGLGAFADDGTLVGVAQFDRQDDGPSAEIAFVVASEWQRQGLGTSLVALLAAAARERGIHHFTASFLADNLPLRRLLRDVAPLLTTTYDAGEGRVDIDLDAP